METMLANRRRPVDSTTPEGRFAQALRDLERGAIARASSHAEREKLRVEKIAKNSTWRTSRTAIYSALNGTRLPSEDTIRALADAWDPRGSSSHRRWLALRERAEDERHGQPLPEKTLAARLVEATQSGRVHESQLELLSEIGRTLGPAPYFPQLVEPGVYSLGFTNRRDAYVYSLRSRLHRARERADLTTQQLAEHTGLDITTVDQAFDLDAGPPTQRTLVLLCRAMQVAEERLSAWRRLLKEADEVDPKSIDPLPPYVWQERP
jgi:transcriptional regulator with XRE-family HTH domain